MEQITYDLGRCVKFTEDLGGHIETIRLDRDAFHVEACDLMQERAFTSGKVFDIRFSGEGEICSFSVCSGCRRCRGTLLQIPVSCLYAATREGIDIAFREFNRRRKTDYVAVDVEQSGRIVVCVQLATPEVCAVFRLFGAVSFPPTLRWFFANANIRKIFHGAMCDVFKIDHESGNIVANVLDTNMMAQSMGYVDCKLNQLCAQLLDRGLSKNTGGGKWSDTLYTPMKLAYCALDAYATALVYESLRGRLGRYPHLCGYGRFPTPQSEVVRNYFDEDDNPRVERVRLLIGSMELLWNVGLSFGHRYCHSEFTTDFEIVTKSAFIREFGNVPSLKVHSSPSGLVAITLTKAGRGKMILIAVCRDLFSVDAPLSVDAFGRTLWAVVVFGKPDCRLDIDFVDLWQSYIAYNKPIAK